MGRVPVRRCWFCLEATGGRTACGVSHYVEMPRFRAEIVFYFDAEDTRGVPMRLQDLNAAAAAVGFDFHGGKAEEGTEPEPDEDGWTRYAPMDDPPA